MIEDIGEVLDDFRREAMPRTRKLMKEHIASYPDDFKRQARTEYLKETMRQIIFETFYLMQDYDRIKSIDDVDSRLYVGERITGNMEKVRALQTEIISLRKPERKGGITDYQIRRAKDKPFTEIHEFKRNQAMCPFHADKDPSMHLFPDNHVYCFSCGKGWDTIGFIMERDGLSFPETVKQLQ